MNFFFFTTKDGLFSRLEIPRFQNRGKVNSSLRLFCASIESNRWIINAVVCEEDENFFYVEGNQENFDSIYFLATVTEVGAKRNVVVKQLLNYNDFSLTVPEFRANLCVSNLAGGFSSYQSDYPFDMTLRRGSITSSVSVLANRDAFVNTLFIRNIFNEPINEEYQAYLVCKKEKVIKKSYSLHSNKTSKINLSAEDINPNHFIVTKGFLGVPNYLSEDKAGHLSFEHTHPPHANTHGANRFFHASRVKNELLEIVG